MVITCIVCDTAVHRKPSKPGKYCSHACYWKDKVGKPGPRLGTIYPPSPKKGKHYGPSKKGSEAQKLAWATVRRERPRKRIYPRGPDHPMWMGGRTTADRVERLRFRRSMQKTIFARDNYTCQICNAYGGDIQVDHIKGWSQYPELRFVESNCRTLCMACHYYVTFKKTMPKSKAWGHNLSKAGGIS